MESQQVYLQAPIKKELREIRILTLAPGTYNDTLRGSFEVESLDYDDIHYTAFSYTWSGPISERTIQIDQAPLRITENLAAALRHFRGPVRPKKLWADAICINQSDDEEKGFQVALMGDIYRNAFRTWVWLGEESDDSDAAIDSIVSFRDFPDFPKNTKAQENQRKEIRHPNHPEVQWQAVSHLLGRPWWRRMWIVQEVLRSPRSILRCGKREVDLELFVHFAASVKTFKKAQSLSQHPFFGILDRWYDHKRIVNSCGFPLESLLDLTCGFRASVRRDKIFALLGMVHQEARSWITPNYAITDRLFLTRLTLYLLRTSWDPLLAVDYSRATNCPSWVPDWTNIDQSAVKKLSDNAAWSNNRSSRPFDSVSPGAYEQPQRTEPSIEELTEYQEPTALLVRGRVMDRVKACIQLPNLADFPDDGPMSARVWKWESCVIEYLQKTRVPYTTNAAPDSLWSKSASPREVLSDFLVKKKQLLGLEIDELQDDAVLAFTWYQFLLWQFGRRAWGQTDLESRIREYRAQMEEHRRERLTARGQNCDGHNYLQDVALHPTKHLSDSMPCGQCDNAHSLQTTEYPSDRKLKSDGGQIWSLTEKGYFFDSKSHIIFQEGDIICKFEDSLWEFVLRKAGETYWTLVGHIRGFRGKELRSWRGILNSEKQLFKLK